MSVEDCPQNETSGRRHRYFLPGLLLFSLALRVGWGLAQPVTAQATDRLPDQREYLSLAQNLLAGRGLQFYDSRFNDVVWAFRTPGYPLWLAAWGAHLRVIRVAQAVLDTSTVLATFLLARTLLCHGHRGAIGPKVAAVLVAVNPLLVFFCGLLLSETLFTAMLVWGMACLVIGGCGAGLEPLTPIRRRTGLGLWLIGGLLLALSSLVRPAALPLPVLLGIASVLLSRRPGPDENWAGGRTYYPRSATGTPGTSPPAGWPLPIGATMLLLTLLVVTPWGFRNWRLLGIWVWTTTNEGVTACDGFNPDANGGSDQSFLRDFPQLKLMGEVERSRYLFDKAWNYVRANPQRAAMLALLKAGRTWSPVPLSREYSDWKRSTVLLAYAVPLDLLVFAGLLGPLGGGVRPIAKVLLMIPAIYFTAVHMMSVGSLRYRVPVEPLLAIIAAGAVAELVRMARLARA